MPILDARATSLTIRFELHRQPDHVIQELVEELGEDANIFPYGIQTHVEVDGEPLGVISTADIQLDATSLPRLHFDVASILQGRASEISDSLRSSIERTVERLTAFPFVGVDTPFEGPIEETSASDLPPAPPGLTLWQRLMSDD